MRSTKSEALDVLRKKYVTTAYTKGLDSKTVLKRYAKARGFRLLLLCFMALIINLINSLLIL